MTKRNEYNKADLNKDACNFFLEIKNDIDKTQKCLKQKRKRFDEESKNGAMLTSKRFIL